MKQKVKHVFSVPGFAISETDKELIIDYHIDDQQYGVSISKTDLHKPYVLKSAVNQLFDVISDKKG